MTLPKVKRNTKITISPMRFIQTPVRTICLMVILLLSMITALGGVDMGNINAKEQANVAGIKSSNGSISN